MAPLVLQNTAGATVTALLVTATAAQAATTPRVTTDHLPPGVTTPRRQGGTTATAAEGTPRGSPTQGAATTLHRRGSLGMGVTRTLTVTLAAHADHPLVPHRQAIQAAVPADTGIVTIRTGVPAPPALDTKSAAVPVDRSGQEDEMRIHRATEAAGADGQNVAVTGVVAGAVGTTVVETHRLSLRNQEKSKNKRSCSPSQMNTVLFHFIAEVLMISGNCNLF